ncbi:MULTISPECIES: penicillin acylase family protein [Sphingobacterium]|uniref:penicillin acylase family protein n=1 Tax=Sphingobacterium TaxID=28453 RepID=UPI000B4962DC|nr:MULTISPECIES: penicillin acylase family protein [Sphingobacterium]
MKKVFDQIFSIGIIVILIFILSDRFFMLPPLGRVLDPYVGIVQNEGDTDQNNAVKVDFKLKDSVNIFFDERMVPHIFANDFSDLAFAQGYIMGKLRLWQMDFIVRSTKGSLSEILSKDYLDFDRNQRRLGYLIAAKRTLQHMEKDPAMKNILESFTAGVNAYVDALDDRQMPIEFKMLGYRPEKWTSLNTVLVMKSMIGNLSGYEEDEKLTKLKKNLSEGDFKELFSSPAEDIEPLARYEHNKFLDLLNDSLGLEYLDHILLHEIKDESQVAFNPNFGSNSWVVGPKKTKSGSPILSNDPHLGLSLPAIWIEMQLVCKGMNVYGVTIPGIPAILIGYNKKVAWGITNGAMDVKDWYKMKISSDYSKYFIDGKWQNTSMFIDTIKVKNDQFFIDTTYYSCHGPIVYDKNFKPQSSLNNHALRWQLHEPSNDLTAFMMINQSHNMEEFKTAISNFEGTMLNFTFASTNGDIAGFLQGKYPIKYINQGAFILDGTTSKHLYKNYIPEKELPHVENPSNQIIISANQTPTDRFYPYYYNGYFIENRAKQIMSRLNHNKQFDLNMMKDIQLDNVSYFASLSVPVLLQYVDQKNLNERERNVISRLSHWDYSFNYENDIAGFYYLWWENLKKLTWDEFKTYGKSPNDDVLLKLIKTKPDNTYFDETETTEVKENAAAVVLKAFRNAISEYAEEEDLNGTKWGTHNPVNFHHLLKVKEMSELRVFSSGHPDAINSISKTWGPSWRMIVELHQNEPVGYGIFPGGQSGNPGSKYYRSNITGWNQGKFYKHKFFQSAQSASNGSERKLTLYDE